MSQIPKVLTWAVAQDGRAIRTICVEASDPSRVTTFIATYHGHVTWHRSPWGKTWDGHAMPSDQLRKLYINIMRSIERYGSDNRHERIRELIAQAAKTHGVTVDDVIAPPTREARYARARGFAIHLLKGEMDLSMGQIAKALKFKNHTGVRHWLQQPLSVVSTPLPQRESARVAQEGKRVPVR